MDDTATDARVTQGASDETVRRLRAIIAHRGGAVLAAGYVLIGVGIAVVISNLAG